MSFPVAGNAYEESVLGHIEAFGWHFTHVEDDDGDPAFSYTVGLAASYGHPEIIVLGLPQETAHSLFSAIAERAARAEPIDITRPNHDLIEGYPCVFVEVDAANRREYARTDAWLYRGLDFRLLQLVWPSDRGVFPWHPDASADFRAAQPVLASVSLGG